LIENFGIETPQQLERKIHLNGEVVQTEITEIAVKEGEIRNLVKGLGLGIL
jgi:hypothetical protein